MARSAAFSRRETISPPKTILNADRQTDRQKILLQTPLRSFVRYVKNINEYTGIRAVLFLHLLDSMSKKLRTAVPTNRSIFRTAVRSFVPFNTKISRSFHHFGLLTEQCRPSRVPLGMGRGRVLRRMASVRQGKQRRIRRRHLMSQVPRRKA